MSTELISKQLGLSRQRTSVLLNEGRIEGVAKVEGEWKIVGEVKRVVAPLVSKREHILRICFKFNYTDQEKKVLVSVWKGMEIDTPYISDEVLREARIYIVMNSEKMKGKQYKRLRQIRP